MSAKTNKNKLNIGFFEFVIQKTIFGVISLAFLLLCFFLSINAIKEDYIISIYYLMLGGAVYAASLFFLKTAYCIRSFLINEKGIVVKGKQIFWKNIVNVQQKFIYIKVFYLENNSVHILHIPIKRDVYIYNEYKVGPNESVLFKELQEKINNFNLENRNLQFIDNRNYYVYAFFIYLLVASFFRLAAFDLSIFGIQKYLVIPVFLFLFYFLILMYLIKPLRGSKN